MRAAPLLVLPLLAVIAGAREAPAECAAPGAAVFPLGDQLPPDPVLYRFEPSWLAAAALRIDGPDGPVAFTSRAVGSGDELRITEIRVRLGRGSITVHGGDGEAPRRFDVGPRAAPPPIPAATAGDVGWVEDAWTCSHSLGLVIKLRAPGVAAFRVRWSDGVEAIVPPNERAFWMQVMGGEVDPAAASVFLGHPNCLSNLIPDRYIGRMDFTLAAIYADGHVQEDLGLPRQDAPAAAPAAPTPAPALAPAPAPPAPAAPRPPPRSMSWVAASGIIAGAITFALVMILRRRPQPVVP